VRFLSRGRVFNDSEKAMIQAIPVITGAAYERGQRPSERGQVVAADATTNERGHAGNVCVIPLPRPWLLAGAMLIGSAVGLLAGWHSPRWCMRGSGRRHCRCWWTRYTQRDRSC